MKGKEKIKEKISVITVVLWIFLITTMIAIVSINIKNTNALESDDEKNIPDAPNYDNIVLSDIHVYCDCGIHNFNNDDEYGEYLCYVTEEGKKYGWSNKSVYVPFEDLFIVGPIIEDDGIYKCNCQVNYEYLIDIFNKNNGVNHYRKNLSLEEYYCCFHNYYWESRAGYITLVWQNNVWNAYNSDESGIGSCSISLTEHNRSNYNEVRLTYDGNGGENVPEVDIKSALDYNSTEFTISSVEPAKLGCRFLGWSDEKDSGKVDYRPGQNITLVEDKTIYAVWEEVSPTKKYGSYRVINEYYTKDKNGKITLEDKVTSDIVTNIEVGKKVGLSENDTVDIEVNKEIVHIVNGEEHNYEYLENNGNIVIEEDVEKEITIKYVRNIGDEKEEIKDNNVDNSIGNVDTSDINIFVYVLVFIIAILMIAVIIVYIIKKNKGNK